MTRKKFIPLTPLKEQLYKLVFSLGAILLFFHSMSMLGLDWARFTSRFSRIPVILRLFVGFEWTVVPTGLQQLLVSFLMAVSALVIGGGIAFVLSFFVAENIAPSPLFAAVIKGVIATIRAIPNLVLILMIVASLGLGTVAAVASLTLSSLGYLTRAFASTIEAQPKENIEALKTTGASWFQIVVHGLIPEVYSSFLAWISIRLELSISDSIILGVVGAGGIGTMLSRAFRDRRHTEATTLIIIILVAVGLVELFLGKMKEKGNG